MSSSDDNHNKNQIKIILDSNTYGVVRPQYTAIFHRIP